MKNEVNFCDDVPDLPRGSVITERYRAKGIDTFGRVSGWLVRHPGGLWFFVDDDGHTDQALRTDPWLWETDEALVVHEDDDIVDLDEENYNRLGADPNTFYDAGGDRFYDLGGF